MSACAHRSSRAVRNRWSCALPLRVPDQALESSPTSTTVSDRYLCGGTGRLSGAGLFLKTLPARSNVEPWQGQTNPWALPSCALTPPGKGPVGEQPRCVQMPTATRYSGLIERNSLRAYSGVGYCVRTDFGSATSPSTFLIDCSISGVRRRTHTGSPRHSNVFSSPGPIVDRSSSTGAPAALARSEGAKEATNGTAAATTPTPPTAAATAIALRLSSSTGMATGPWPLGTEADVDMKTPLERKEARRGGRNSGDLNA